MTDTNSAGEQVPELTWQPSSHIDAVREVVRQAETMLGAQLTVAIAADARASTQANIFVAIAAALAAAGISLTIGGIRSTGIGLLISALGSTIAAALSGLAARPVRYEYAGFDPWILSTHSHSEEGLLKWVATSHNEAIKKNRKQASTHGKLTKIAFFVGLFSVAIPTAIGLAAEVLAPRSLYEDRDAPEAAQQLGLPPVKGSAMEGAMEKASADHRSRSNPPVTNAHQDITP